MDKSDPNKGCCFSVRKGGLERGLTPFIGYLMARDAADRTEAGWKCITDQEATDLLEHWKFQSHIKELFYHKDSQSRNPEGLWNLHRDRYSKLV